MSTSNSPLWKLQKEAKKMAKHLKRPGVLPNKAIVTVGIVMDDKLVTLALRRAAILSSSREALELMIVREMSK
jgi:hypothetical protein